MLRNIATTIGLLLLVFHAQPQSYTRSIPWEDGDGATKSSGPKEAVSHGGNHLWFNHAIYPKAESMIPYFTDLIPISSTVADISDLRVWVENAKYSSLTQTELDLLGEDFKRIDTHSPKYFVARSRGRSYLQLAIPAVRLNPNTGAPERLIDFTISTQVLQPPPKTKALQKAAQQSVLRQGNWVRIRTNRTGIHRISFAELQTMGFASPENITLWGHDGRQLPYSNSQANPDDLMQIPIWVDRGADNTFNTGDFIYFFAQGPVSWAYSTVHLMFLHQIHAYSEFTHYFLTTSQGNPLRVADQTPPLGASTRTSTSFDALVHFERNDTNLIKSGRQWFGESFDIVPTHTFSTALSKPASGGTARIMLHTSARSGASSSYTAFANGTNLGSLTHLPIALDAIYSNIVSLSTRIFDFNLTDNFLDISLTFNSPSPASKGWLDYIIVNARQRLEMGSGQLLFRDIQSIGPDAITTFTIGNASTALRVWDVTNFFAPSSIPLAMSYSNATFTQATSVLREFVAFTPAMAHSVEAMGTVANQNIHGEPQPEMVIVAHPTFLTHANDLASLHQTHSGLRTLVVTTQQVYNEFSSGTPDVTAIRNMMRMFYQRSNRNEAEMPRYLLLMGDGSYNNFRLGSGNTNFIPTYQSANGINPTSSYVTDDFLGLLDTNEGEMNESLGLGLLDIGIGRIPCSTPQEAATAVAKIRQYLHESSQGSWNNQLCFIGDDGDNNIHMSQSNRIASYIKSNYPFFNVNKIYLDAYPRVSTAEGFAYPDASNAINSRVNQGVLILNYIGHANTRWLAHEKILLANDIRNWRNFERLNIFVTATCEFSRFDDFMLQSAGEISLFAPRGGSVGLITTTRVVYSDANFNLSQRLYETLFAGRDDHATNDPYYRLGDAVRIAKNRSGTGINKLNFMLLGDPALMLHLPTFEVEIKEVNSTPIDQPLDTLRALSRVTVKGVARASQSDEAISGEATISLFDKETTITTMGHYDDNPILFTTRENLIYRGRSTLSNGEFNATFIIPKDIMYRYGTGRFSLFAKSGGRTGAGYFEDFIVGGISDSVGTDNLGPDIEIFMNDSKFVPGGTTDPNPTLIVLLTDSSGINTTGAGIGHDLTATLINENQTTYTLNDFYTADLDSYQKGRVEYQLSELPLGPQTLRVKAWDVYNNSAEAEIQFTVQSDAKFSISHVLNYPNPFTERTAFYFEHNQPYEDIDVTIQIFSPSGKLVKTIVHYHPASPSYRIGPLEWDGLDDFGDRIGRGVYFYRVRARASNGLSAEKHQKLVILK